jgi:hypothetical protein
LNVLYRTSFLRDLKKLKRQKNDYQAICTLAFDTLPQADTGEITALAWKLKAMQLNWCECCIAVIFTAISPNPQ